MLDVATIALRLREAVPELRSIQGAVELSALLSAGKPMVGRPFAHVVPTGLRGQKPDLIAGAYSQPVDRTFSIVLTIPTVNDPAGDKALVDAERLEPAIIAALVGWGPENAPGTVWLQRSMIQRFEPGLIVYGIDFAITELLRI